MNRRRFLKYASATAAVVGASALGLDYLLRPMPETKSQSITQGEVSQNATTTSSSTSATTAVAANIYEIRPALLIPKMDGQFTPVSSLQKTPLGQTWKDPLPYEYSDVNFDSFASTNYATDLPVEGYFGIKEHENSLYFIIPLPSWTEDRYLQNGDYLSIVLDPKNDKSETLQEDDILYGLYSESFGKVTPKKYTVVNGQWKESSQTNDFELTVGLNKQLNPFSGRPFYMYEGRIPEPSEKFGIAIEVLNYPPPVRPDFYFYDWPSTFIGGGLGTFKPSQGTFKPSQWGTAISSD